MSNPDGGWTPAEPPKFPGEDPKWQAPGVAEKPGIIALRPLSFGEILEGSFALFRRHAGTVLSISAVLALIQALLTTVMVVVGAGGSINKAAEALQWQPPANADTPDELLSAFNDLQLVLLSIGFAAIASFFVSLIGTGLFTVVTAEAVIGKKVSPAIAWSKVKYRIGALLLTTALAFLLFIFGVACIIGIVGLSVALGQEQLAVLAGILGVLFLIYAAFKLSLINTAVVLEKVPPVTALRRSWRLTKQAWWRTFGMVVVSSIAAAIVASIVSLPLVSLGTASGVSSDGITPGAIVASNFLTTWVQGVISLPFVSAAVSLVYIDLRMRKEGLAQKLIQASQE